MYTYLKIDIDVTILCCDKIVLGVFFLNFAVQKRDVMTVHRKIKTFVRRLHNGNVVKVVREHYVRDDIPCGHPNCGACSLEEGRPRLSEHPTLSTDLCPFPHVIIPDTNVLLGAVCCDWLFFSYFCVRSCW